MVLQKVYQDFHTTMDFALIDIVVEAILYNNFSLKYIIGYALNLQGAIGTTSGGVNLWFTTLIMICYVITPILQWMKNKRPKAMTIAIFIILTILLQVVLAYTTDIGLIAGHTLSWCVFALGIYVLGYFVGGRILNDNIGMARIAGITVAVVFVALAGLLAKSIWDGHVIYDRIIAYYSIIFIELWISIVVYKVATFIKSEKIKKVMNHIDSISYEFYMVHGLIITALTYGMIQPFGVAVYIIATIVLAYVAAVLLHLLCEQIYKRINKT